MKKIVLNLLLLTVLGVQAVFAQETERTGKIHYDNITVVLGFGLPQTIGSKAFKDNKVAGNFAGGFDFTIAGQWQQPQGTTFEQFAPFFAYSLGTFGDANSDLMRYRGLNNNMYGVGTDYYLGKNNKLQNVFLHGMVGLQRVRLRDSSYVTYKNTYARSGSLGGKVGIGYEFRNWRTPVQILLYANYTPLGKLGNYETKNHVFYGLRVSGRIGKAIIIPKKDFQFKVTDENDNPLMGVRIHYVPTGGTYGETTYTNEQGIATVRLQYDKGYRIDAQREGYNDKTDYVQSPSKGSTNTEVGAFKLSKKLDTHYTYSNILRDNNNNPLANVGVRAFDANTLETLANTTTNANGYFTLTLPKGREAHLSVADYWVPSMRISEKAKPDKSDFIKMFGVFENHKMDNLYFDSGKYELRQDTITTKVLNDIIFTCKQTTVTNGYLEITAHTDSDGNPSENQRLSERRAQAVVTHLKNAGVTLRIEAVGKGQKEPVCQDAKPSEKCKEQNRRVVLRFVK